MKTTVEFLDAVKARQGIRSDYGLAKFLGFDQSRVAHYRAGRRFLSEESAMKIAECLELAPGYVLACIQAERADTDQVRKAWSKAAKALAGSAVALLVGCTVIAAGPAAFNITSVMGSGASQAFEEYTLCALVLRHFPSHVLVELALCATALLFAAKIYSARSR